MTDLATLARAAGITDASAIDLADTSLPTARAQLADLKARYPAIFPKPVREMSADEYRAAKADMLRQGQRNRSARQNAAELARITERYRRKEANQ
jgi:hypothetical protein